MIPVMIVPILTGPQILYAMLNSIDYPVAKLIIIDNGDCLNTSTGWPVENVQSTKVIKMPANLGVAGSWNLGIKAAPFAPWWLIVNFDIAWPAGSLKMFAEQASTDQILLSRCEQPWSAFALGENIVRRVGLFDEGFHPAYFEDNDYSRRCSNEIIRPSAIPVQHANSSTINNGYVEKNYATYASNATFFQAGGGGWSLDRRRVNSWD
jgi:GT2 family glycosyltransferase